MFFYRILIQYVKSVKLFGYMQEMSYLCSEKKSIAISTKKSGAQDSHELCTPYLLNVKRNN